MSGHVTLTTKSLSFLWQGVVLYTSHRSGSVDARSVGNSRAAAQSRGGRSVCGGSVDRREMGEWTWANIITDMMLAVFYNIIIVSPGKAQQEVQWLEVGVQV